MKTMWILLKVRLAKTLSRALFYGRRVGYGLLRLFISMLSKPVKSLQLSACPPAYVLLSCAMMLLSGGIWGIAPVAADIPLNASTQTLDEDEDDTEEEEDADALDDPLEGWNRAMFVFNEGFDALAFNPVAHTYTILVPPVIQTGITQALANAATPLTTLNYMFQGQPNKAGRSLVRFLINTTLGVLGLFDVARELDLPPETTTFAETLEGWGAEPGPYIIYPFLGPSTARDSAGLLVDCLMDPLRIYFYHRGWQARNRAYQGAQFFNAKKEYVDSVRELIQTSIDPYNALKSIYRQTRLRTKPQTPESP